MIMMEEPEMAKASATEAEKRLREFVKEMVEDLEDNEIIQIPLEGMVIAYGQEA